MSAKQPQHQLKAKAMSTGHPQQWEPPTPESPLSTTTETTRLGPLPSEGLSLLPPPMSSVSHPPPPPTATIKGADPTLILGKWEDVRLGPLKKYLGGNDDAAASSSVVPLPGTTAAAAAAVHAPHAHAHKSPGGLTATGAAGSKKRKASLPSGAAPGAATTSNAATTSAPRHTHLLSRPALPSAASSDTLSPVLSARDAPSAGAQGGNTKSRQASRKVSHSLIERRRREKINECLAEMKARCCGSGTMASKDLNEEDEDGEYGESQSRKRRRSEAAPGGGQGQGSKEGMHKLDILQGTLRYISTLESELSLLRRSASSSRAPSLSSTSSISDELLPTAARAPPPAPIALAEYIDEDETEDDLELDMDGHDEDYQPVRGSAPRRRKSSGVAGLAGGKEKSVEWAPALPLPASRSRSSTTVERATPSNSLSKLLSPARSREVSPPLIAEEYFPSLPPPLITQTSHHSTMTTTTTTVSVSAERGSLSEEEKAGMLLLRFSTSPVLAPQKV